MTIQANFPAIKPSLMLDFANTKQLDSRITYTRASTASYYDGVTTSKAEENQLTYSNEISTARWTGAGILTTINNSTSPDGTTTATLLTASASADARMRLTTTQAVSTTHTYSVYAKVGASSWLRLRNIGSNDCSGWFNLTTGLVGTVSGGTSAITSVGSGWYRCSITSTSAASIANNLLDMGASSGDNTAAAAGGETISVWGVQLEARSSVSALTVTTTQAITNYIPKLQSAASGVARFDNNPTTGESLGLLIEESRTNLLTYSSDFSNAAYNLVNATVAVNTDIAPDGTLTADTLTGTASFGRIYQSVNYTAGAWTFSIYVKKKSSSSIFAIAFSETGGADEVSWNINTGVVASQGANVSSTTVTDVGLYWRITATSTRSASTGIQLRIFAGYGTNINPVIWGAQLEAGAFATSYIPTVASQVTRAADAASMTGTNFSSWFNAGEGTIYGEYNTGTNSGSGDGPGNGRGVLNINDGTTTNRLRFAASINSFQVITNNTTVANIVIGTIAANTTYKMSSCYKVDDFQASRDNVLGTADTSGQVPLGLNAMNIGTSSVTSGILGGTIKKIAYYPLRVTNAQLQALTS